MTPRQPLPPLNTLGYVLADPATALPLLEGGQVLVFSSDAAPKLYRDRDAGRELRGARVIAVAMVPLMLAGEAPVGEVAVVTDVARRALEAIAEGRRGSRRRLAP